MSLQDELNEISTKTEECDDLEELTQFQKRCEAILTNVSKTVATEQDAELRQHLEEVGEQAKETLRTVKQRLADVKIARMDPEYEQRKAQKQREEQLKKQKGLEEAQKFISQGGLGNLLGGLFGAAAGAASAPKGSGGSAAPSSSSAGSASAPAAVQCAQCGAELKPNAKFCPECGTKQV